MELKNRKDFEKWVNSGSWKNQGLVTYSKGSKTYKDYLYFTKKPSIKDYGEHNFILKHTGKFLHNGEIEEYLDNNWTPLLIHFTWKTISNDDLNKLMLLSQLE